MTREQLDRWAALVGLGVYLLVGIPIWYTALAGDDPTWGPLWLWMAFYVVYLAAMIGVWYVSEHNRWLTPQRVFSVMVVAGAAAVLLARSQGVTPILLVFAGAVGAIFLTRRAAVAVVVVNTVIVAVSTTLRGSHPMDLVLTTFLYGMLQTLLLFTTWGGQREKEAAERLAVAHAELRSASALLTESSRARERLRIARELHDVLGHKLTALALELETASHQSTPPARERVTRARQLAKELLGDVRTAVGELRSRPPELRSALDTLVADLPRPRVHLHVDDTIELDEERITAMIRCTQEIVTNAIRHSDAENLWIDVAASTASDRLGENGQRMIALDARDDGRGVPMLKLGHGLTGLRERIEQLGGNVSFDTRDGFRIRAVLPAAERVPGRRSGVE